MVDIFNSDNINKKNYNFYKPIYFFGFGDKDYSSDSVRILKLLYILISFILNLLIIISLLKKKKKKFSIALILTGNVLIINFIHSFCYSFEWILKEEGKNLIIDKNGNSGANIADTTYEIGGLLIGNPNNLGVCKFQGFSLIFSALSQDILINIFFYIVNRPKVPNKNLIRIILIVLGYFIPLLISLIYILKDAIGINDKFCYIKKFYKTENSYKYNENYAISITIIYSLRFINLIISSILLYKIIIYVKQNKLKNMYILKLSAILIVQVLTILIGLIYRIFGLISESFSRNFARIFLCINTLDAILFPLSYSLSNGIYNHLFCGISTTDNMYLSDDQADVLSNKSTNSSKSAGNHEEKTFAMVDVKDDNNFDLSYT